MEPKAGVVFPKNILLSLLSCVYGCCLPISSRKREEETIISIILVRIYRGRYRGRNRLPRMMGVPISVGRARLEQISRGYWYVRDGKLIDIAQDVRGTLFTFFFCFPQTISNYIYLPIGGSKYFLIEFIPIVNI